MIRPILPPNEVMKLILSLYQEHPVFLCSIGILFGLSIAGLILFIIRESQKSPTEENKGGEQ